MKKITSALVATFLLIPALSLAAPAEKFSSLKEQLYSKGETAQTTKAPAKSVGVDPNNIPTTNSPLFCQKRSGPCYLMARTMLYNTFSPNFTTPEKVKKANGGSEYMKWAAVGSPNLVWVYPQYRNRWDNEVKSKVDEFLRAGKPAILQGITKNGYQHAVLIVGKKNGEYLVNNSGPGNCGKSQPLSSLYREKNIWGIFFYDKKK
ncbi:MAG: hypothetical protein WCP97_01615 [bacterium]